MKDVVFCKAVRADVIKEDRCPDWDCSTCPEIRHIPDIAGIYLSNPQELPSPLHLLIDDVVTEDLEAYLPKTLKELKKEYSDIKIKQICGALLKFQIAALRYYFFIPLNRNRKKRDKGREKAIRALELLKYSHYRTGHFDALLNELRNKKAVSFTPLMVLKYWWKVSDPVEVPVGMKGNPFLKALYKVVFELLDKRKSKRITEALAAGVIEDFSQNSKHSLFKFFKEFKNKNITAKHINNALYS